MNPKSNFIIFLGIGILTCWVSVTKANIESTTESETTEGHLDNHPVPNPNDSLSVPEPKGTEFQLGNLTIYESPHKNTSKTLLISIYDIFGLHRHVKYIADEVAESGDFIVVIPDFFHGHPIPLNGSRAEFAKHIHNFTSKDGLWVQVKQELQEVIKKYKSEGVTSVGLYGFCWGGLMSVFAAVDPDFSSDVKAIGLVHSSKIDTEDVNKIKVPAILMPSSSEQDMVPFLNILNKNVKPESEHRRFEGMHHGFAGAASDFSNSTIRENVNEVIQRLSKFFTRVIVDSA